ncbi:hypothetical protein ACFQKF_21160 [Halalkalicoccus sp. GCM10025322]|uniref:hypothetical protein n=1 Tax=Halalkalicoccus TaxID=332246 RepID=UPI002F968C02
MPGGLDSRSFVVASFDGVHESLDVPFERQDGRLDVDPVRSELVEGSMSSSVSCQPVSTRLKPSRSAAVSTASLVRLTRTERSMAGASGKTMGSLARVVACAVPTTL